MPCSRTTDLGISIKNLLWILVERHISRWALRVSQWQLQRYLLHFRADPLCSSRVTLNERLYIDTTCFQYPPKWLQYCLFVSWLGPHETAAVAVHVLCTPYSHAQVYSVSLFDATLRLHVCLAITGHMNFCQNDRDLLHATSVRRGWNRYRNKSTESWHGEENSLAAPAGTGTWDLSNTFCTLRFSYPRSPGYYKKYSSTPLQEQKTVTNRITLQKARHSGVKNSSSKNQLFFSSSKCLLFWRHRLNLNPLAESW